jgi:hypothetical protein
MTEPVEQETFALSVSVEQPLLPQERWHLPEYSTVRPCSKCGGMNLTTVYHDGVKNWQPCYQHWWKYQYESPGSSTSQDTFPEHMDRRCTRCNYEWCEAVLAAVL